MTFKLSIAMIGAAFDDELNGEELARLLAELAEKLHHRALGPGNEDLLVDLNGNICGRWKVTK